MGGISGTTTLTNPYHYANNDPLNMVDPTWLSATQDCNLSQSGRCVYVVNDMIEALGSSTYKSGGAVGQNWGSPNLPNPTYEAGDYAFQISSRRRTAP